MPNPSPPADLQSLKPLAQTGDVRAIETLLAQSFGDSHLRFEVARRGTTLYAFLTVAGGETPAAYASAVYDVVADLAPQGLDRLEVIDGTDRPQADRWRQPFYLPAGDWTSTPASPSTPEDGAPTERRSPQLPDFLQRPKSVPNPAPIPAEAALVAPPPPALGERAAALVESLARSKRIKNSLGLAALIALGLGLGAAVAQWRYGQPDSLAPLSSEVSAQEDPLDSTPPAGFPSDSSAPGIPFTDSPASDSPSPESPTPETDPALAPEPGIYIDGISEPEVERSEESVAAEANPAPPQLTPIFDPSRLTALNANALQAPPTLTVNAVGDVIPGTNYPNYRLPQDWQYLFGGIQYQLQQADIVFGNFESTLTEVRNSPKGAGRPNVFAFRTPPWYASVLKVAGFNVMSVANNHSFDFGDQGFIDTMANLEQEGIKAVGRKGEIVYTEAKGLKLAFIAFSHLNQHNTVHDLDAAAALVQEAEQNADIVVVSFHAGKEGSDATATRNQTEYFLSENRGNVVQFSRTVVDHGADLVLGHGPHVPRAIELYNNKLIAYSLGNFLGYRTLSTAGNLGTSLILTTNLDGNGDFVSGRVVPVALDRNGVPYLDDHFKGVILVRTLTRRDFPDTPLTIDDEGYIWRNP
ncbi:MAG: CapA family protein [Spirulina sp.]